jgi:hypothetical protein
MSNAEGMYTVYFIKGLSVAKPPFEILRFDIQDSAVRFFGNMKFHTSAASGR